MSLPPSVDKLRALAWCGGGVVVGDRSTATHVVCASGAPLPGERVTALKPDAMLRCAA